MRPDLAVNHPLAWTLVFNSDCADSVRSFFQPGIVPRCFPFYIHDPDGNRRENITDRALDEFRARYNDKVISKWSIFDYVYGMLHHPAYRAGFSAHPIRELPPIPLAPDFRAFQRAGQQLIRAHTDYRKNEPWELELIENPCAPRSQRIGKLLLSKDKTSLAVDESVTIAGIPPAAFEYRMGDRSALEWVIDHYPSDEAPHADAMIDAGRELDRDQVVRLVGQIVRMSVETVNIIHSLAANAIQGGGK